VGYLLGELSAPRLLLELSVVETVIKTCGASLEEVLNNPGSNLLEGCMFIHATVVDTSNRDDIAQTQGLAKSVTICEVDSSPL